MRRHGWRTLLAALSLTLVLPATAQEEGEPYFSLTSNRTFAPGEKPTIQIWGRNVDTLEFRVYRVNDPVLFFRRLGDPHQFGGKAPPLPRKRTLIEWFHSFKRDARILIRDFYRAQFDADSRGKIRDYLAEKRRRRLRGVTQFAQVPLLNSQQLVSAWRETLSQAREWESQTIPIKVKQKGLYLVEAVHGGLRAYTILILTDLAVLTKASPGRITALAVDRSTGAPVSNCELWTVSDKKEQGPIATDGDGLAEFHLEEPRPETTLVLARHGESFAAQSLYSWYLNSDPDRYRVGYIYTDRPVYRPGHTVHWKGILRDQVGAEYRIPERAEVEIEIQDPESRVVQRQSLRLSPMGTIRGEYQLPASAALGYYSLEVRSGDASLEGGFSIEEYKKPEFEVRVKPSRPRILEGESNDVTFEARYFFGEPVANGKVTYVVHRTRYWSPLLYRDEEYDEEGGEEFDYVGEQILEGQGQLDADGRLTVNVAAGVSDDRNDQRYRVEARVTDPSRREIAGQGAFVATYGSFLLDVTAEPYVYRTGEKARILVRARNYEGNPVDASFRLELLRPRWRREAELPPLFTSEGSTGADGEEQVEIPLPAGGDYRVRASARTPEGRDLQSETYLWVAGGDEFWFSERRERLTIVPDKKSYRPGEVAKILIVTGVPETHLLLTMEGKQLHDRRVIKTDGPTVSVEVPIRPEFTPNFFVGAAFLRNNRFYQGSKNISVPPVDREISVQVDSSRAEYRPGDFGVFTVKAEDHAGRPVSAEFSLGVVDEAIYAIRPEAMPDPLNFFYGRTGNRVGTDSSLNYYFSGESGIRRMRLTRLKSSPPFAQLKPERLVEPRVRKAFPDTILWLADLVTGTDGRAEARVTFPDALTTWRATARGVTRDTRVGSAVHRTVVRKNLILRLSAPRFFTQGDEVVLSATVHNYLAGEKTARVSLRTEGLEILQGGKTDVSIPSHGDARVDWRVRAGDAREVKLLGEALTDEESDAMEISLPVIPFGVKLSQSRTGSLREPEGTAETDLVFPSESIASSRALDVIVTPSLAGTVFGALGFLTSYPYGCTEQTMSSFLPNVIVARALKELGVPSRVNPADLEKKTRIGLERLYEFQHEDGGWGWWQTDDSQAFMTAYVLSGLAQGLDAGTEIRHDVIQRGGAWLQSVFDREKQVLPDLRAYMVYALQQAGMAGRDRVETVWARRSELTPYGVALIGLALDLAGDPRADEAAALLEGSVRTEGEEAHWRVDRDSLLDFSGDSSPEATAHALKLLSRRHRQSPLQPKIIRWLLNHRNEGYYWDSTKQTALVIHGLIEYLKESGELHPNFGVTVWVNDREVLTRRFTAEDAVASIAPIVRVPSEALAEGTNRIRIRKSGAGLLYWSARAEYRSPVGKEGPTGTVALNLLREYFRLVPEREEKRIVFRLEPLTGVPKPGDVLATRLTLSGRDWRYLLVEDPIPAGTEFIERDDLYEIKEKPPWWSFSYTRREFHDDRADFFQTHFDRGQIQYLYLLKVVNPGTFRVSPAWVQPMYQPQVMATTESATLEVRAEESK